MQIKSQTCAPFWNACIVLVFYLIVVWLLTSLRSLNKELETRVRQRTAALTDEMSERKRLEHELLGISEREQRRRVAARGCPLARELSLELIRPSQFDLKLQKALRVPDPTFLVQYERNPPGPPGPDTIGVGVSFADGIVARSRRGNFQAICRCHHWRSGHGDSGDTPDPAAFVSVVRNRERSSCR
jgi:hypothetical protein